MNDGTLHPQEVALRQRSLLLRVVRWGFFILIVTVALVTLFQESSEESTGISLVVPWWLPVIVAIALYALVLIVDLLTPAKKISMISGVFFGIIVGMVAAIAASYIIDLVLGLSLSDKAITELAPFTRLLKVLLGIALCYLGIATVLQTQDDFRLVVPYVEFSKQIRGVKPVIIDTSALIDARIAEVAATGLLQGPVVIPRFVVGELQLLADSGDRLRRARGRRGLDVVQRLQRLGTLDISIDESPVVAKAVDQMLIELAKQSDARIMTGDTGLTRAAQIQGVAVLNLHDIASAFRPAIVPGEQVRIRLIRAGEQPRQAIGYLPDGTMVVAEGAEHLIGEETTLIVSGTMQTTAGRLVFARPPSSRDPNPDRDPEADRDEGAAANAVSDRDTNRPNELPARGAVATHDAGSAPSMIEAAEPVDHAVADAEIADSRQEHGSSPALIEGAPPRRPGPFPPKPPARRSPTPRNPRR